MSVTPTDVLVVGEALIDLIPAESGKALRVPGGSPANVALGLSRLGVPTSLLTHLADDSDGQLKCGSLRTSGVQILPDSFTAPRTSVAEALLRSDGSAKYLFDHQLGDARHRSDPDPTPPARRIARCLPGARRIPSSGTGRTRRTGRRHGVHRSQHSTRRHALPRIRPGMPRMDHRPGCRREALRRRRTVDLPRLTIESVASRLQALSPRKVYITQGPAGVLIATDHGIDHVPGIPTAVVDTVAAGDSFMAAVLSKIVRNHGEQLPQAAVPIAQYAVRAAAITVSRRGADLPRHSELPS